MTMTIDQVVDAYAEELTNWNLFSDPQRAYVDEDNHIVVCLRYYNWYITKEPITNELDGIKALFEIDWIAEYDDEEPMDISFSKYWNKM